MSAAPSEEILSPPPRALPDLPPPPPPPVYRYLPRIAFIGKPESGKTLATYHLSDRFRIQHVLELRFALARYLINGESMQVYHTCALQEREALQAAGWSIVFVSKAAEDRAMEVGNGAWKLVHDGTMSKEGFRDPVDAVVDEIIEAFNQPAF